MAINVAILGGGIFAREEHLPAVQASKDLSLKAVYSRSLKSAQTLSPETHVDYYSDDSAPGGTLNDLLSRSDIQAVIIALPILQQPEYIRKALSAGKHVLSEKPVAENLKAAQELIAWYYENINTKKVMWSVAENFRYLNSFQYAREQAQKAGRLLGFSVKMHIMIEPEGKYIDTPWRKEPRHQGGFILDAGVHFTAALRVLLGPEDTIDRLSAHSAQLQKYLPPVDTIDAILKTKHGATGTISVSFGTTFTGSEYAMACERGTVHVSKSTVTTVFDGKEEKVDAQDEGSGVTPEVRAWGEAMVAGERNGKQSPEEALADLELVENMLKSGETGGQPVNCVFQL